MKQLIRRLSRVGDSSQQEERLLRGMSPGKGRRRESAEVPEGHLPVYVGEEMERFVVRADLLSRPVFVELLRRSAEEYGYEQRGVLRIPAPPPSSSASSICSSPARSRPPTASTEIWTDPFGEPQPSLAPDRRRRHG
ncbi:unnamed protein product [Spirodela intermedia]|uniref:Uncharacterized protein n=1 Tax=Spirodela intermedia TaxID=51605 RepID=A0A7I8IKJ4_SPIIN|nr:unnamed protein product [Spirodela intermedia]CAA6658034.1 unnamed protein product [Spirodela intermedia]